jgi:hypothetical protein
VILHDWDSKGKRTHKTLSKVLPTLRARGFRVVTLTELEGLRKATGPDAPTIDHLDPGDLEPE